MAAVAAGVPANTRARREGSMKGFQSRWWRSSRAAAPAAGRHRLILRWIFSPSSAMKWSIGSPRGVGQPASPASRRLNQRSTVPQSWRSMGRLAAGEVEAQPVFRGRPSSGPAMARSGPPWATTTAAGVGAQLGQEGVGAGGHLARRLAPAGRSRGGVGPGVEGRLADVVEAAPPVAEVDLLEAGSSCGVPRASASRRRGPAGWRTA